MDGNGWSSFFPTEASISEGESLSSKDQSQTEKRVWLLNSTLFSAAFSTHVKDIGRNVATSETLPVVPTNHTQNGLHSGISIYPSSVWFALWSQPIPTPHPEESQAS